MGAVGAIQMLLPLMVAASLAGLIVVVGLEAGIDDFLYLFRRPAQLARAVLSVNVIVPAAAVAIIALFPLTFIAKVGILLMAVSPMPPLVPGKELKVGAGRSYAFGLYIALILQVVVIVPLTLAILGRVYDRQISLPVAEVARNVALDVLLPLAVGLAIHRLAPGLARRASPILSLVATLLLVAAVVPLVIAAWPAMVALIGNGTLVAMALVPAIGLTAGHLLGGPDPRNRAALAMASATRHPGIAMLIAGANHTDKHVTAVILAFALNGVVVAIPYQLWLKRRAPAAAATGHGSRSPG